MRNKPRKSSVCYCPPQKNDLHVELDHMPETITHATAKSMGIQVTCIFKPCEDHALGKSKKSRVSKKAVAWSKILWKRLFFNISSPWTPIFGGMFHWLLVMEDSSNYAWSFYLKEKFDLADVTLGLVKNLKNKINMQIQCLGCDNAGKDVCTQKCCLQKGLQKGRLGLVFEFTASGMPQQNCHIKWKFITLFNLISTMLSGRKLNAFL